MLIDAQLLADAGCLARGGWRRPEVWLCRMRPSHIGQWITPDTAPDIRAYCIENGDAALDNPQTAFGVALKLDAWERYVRLHDRNPPRADWAERVARGEHGVLSKMIARLTHIGLDHRIRRALGEEPKAGTLAFLALKTPDDDRPWWCWTPDFGARGEQIAFLSYRPDPCSDAYRCVPALAGITDPAEALAAIAQEVTR